MTSHTRAVLARMPSCSGVNLPTQNTRRTQYYYNSRISLNAMSVSDLTGRIVHEVHIVQAHSLPWCGSTP